jgi:competence ComEA-like helix-hairpin-helix protein
LKGLESRPEKGHLSRQGRWLVILAIYVLAGGMLTTVLASEPADGSAGLGNLGPEELNARGEQATGAVCLSCHGWDSIFGGPRQTADQWDFIVSEMVSRGAQGTPEQIRLIRRYLKWVWGVVWINRATADDLAQVIGLSPEDAEAVVAWRQEQGDFTDLESLKQVPGVDAAVIDAQADAIMFN